MPKYHILKNDILTQLRDYQRVTESDIAGRLAIRVNDHTDTIATLHMLEDAHVIIFDSEQALALVPAVRRFADDLDFRLPFPSVMFQFSEPIPETDILKQEKDEPDRILVLVVSQTENDINNASVWFESTSVNRAQWANESVTPLCISPTADEDEETDLLLFVDKPTLAEIKIRNKEIVRLLACAMVAYINCENITLERQAVDEKVNRKRQSKGKRPLEPYYTVRVRGVRYDDNAQSGRTGRHVGFRFDVRGHFRRLDDGRLTWVRAHQRGVQHERYIPKVYEVD